MRSAQKGFTLVEIAIVLVIIGLLLGGILKGQEMITQAKIKNLIGDFSGIAAAYHGYQDRYRAMPGDDQNADTRWATPLPAATKGNGDNVLGGLYNSSTDTHESRMWWDHLRRAGFISGTGFTQPMNATSGIVGAQTGDGAAAPATALSGLSGLLVCSSNLPDKIAIAVDNQLDNGNSATGTVRAQLHAATDGASPAISGTAAASYAETGSNTYTMCRTL